MLVVFDLLNILQLLEFGLFKVVNRLHKAGWVYRAIHVIFFLNKILIESVVGIGFECGMLHE